MDAAATESLELETVNLKDEAQPQNKAPEEKELSRTNHKFQCICLTAFFCLF